MSTKKKRIIAAMSGGVDSSVAAALFVEAGWEVIGVTLKMKECDNSREKTKACCGLDDNIQARMAAGTLGIRHYFLDLRPQFEERVLRYARNEYSRGRTPNPCVMCNDWLKFGALLEYADTFRAEGVITGHYARIERDEENEPVLMTGVDDTKNQTYFLSTLSSDQLRRSFMPLGEYTKPQVREMARERGLENADKSESQDACFGYRGESFSQTLLRYFDSPATPGRIIGPDGAVLRHHAGMEHFTIGQRRGLGVALGKPAYVSWIDGTTGDVYLTTEGAELESISFEATDITWIADVPQTFSAQVQIRYNQQPVAAVVQRGDDTALITFEHPVRAVTPGQTAAFYDGNRVLGGGWIEQVFGDNNE
ncbi:MAG: tRNA 2-thiouridine(34) synthase MnmA [Fibrobacterota bacterium]